MLEKLSQFINWKKSVIENANVVKYSGQRGSSLPYRAAPGLTSTGDVARNRGGSVRERCVRLARHRGQGRGERDVSQVRWFAVPGQPHARKPVRHMRHALPRFGLWESVGRGGVPERGAFVSQGALRTMTRVRREPQSSCTHHHCTPRTERFSRITATGSARFSRVLIATSGIVRPSNEPNLFKDTAIRFVGYAQTHPDRARGEHSTREHASAARGETPYARRWGLDTSE